MNNLGPAAVVNLVSACFNIPFTDDQKLRLVDLLTEFFNSGVRVGLEKAKEDYRVIHSDEQLFLHRMDDLIQKLKRSAP